MSLYGGHESDSDHFDTRQPRKLGTMMRFSECKKMAKMKKKENLSRTCTGFQKEKKTLKILNNAFHSGNFADSFGDDFLGLRELGIAAEFNLTSLTIPKKLLKGKGKANAKEGPSTYVSLLMHTCPHHSLSPSSSKPSEPPPPFPPPPPFIPLDSKRVDEQIGLLRPYYQQRISALAGSVPPHPAHSALFTASDTSSIIDPSQSQLPRHLMQDGTGSPPPIILPDDLPSPAHTKISPLGQVMKSASNAASAKKKAKAKPPAVPPPMQNGPSSGPSQGGFEEFPGPSLGGGKVGGKGPSTPSKGSKKVNSALPPVVMASA